ncbi:MAG: protein-methionine-sulfoxide reductase catalytic subunit MsrP [Alphaproteobacteria bacterium]|jgi:sulfoxide reductase catalytic subunit YedY|nr:protein-methionine-sulfoxide reductase catalytic subunit MsrP [Alphaproteobacteria bacterium]|tara:strand:+ start:1297 stop:2286 length:990 start_codon:yes stop_codon:yes gene_type:complete
MLIRKRRGWEIPESAATPESLFFNRRAVLKGLGAIGGAVAAGALPGAAHAAHDETGEADPSADLYPAAENKAFKLERPLTPEKLATHYNNYYEFGSQKEIFRLAQELAIRPWTIEVGGLVEQELTLDIDDLLRQMPLEERLYRHRCVEAWSIAVPYSGFPLKALVDLARPLGGAKYLVMQTFEKPEVARGQKQFWYPWPYTDGLTMAEAVNELAFIATGYYGKPMPKQNGAPLRLAVPWKYGFKHVKGIHRLTFAEERPVSFWQEIQGREYGFWANVNPEVPHPRWSQASEKFFGPDGVERIPTQLFNGYAEFVAGLYEGMDKDEALYM